MKKGGGASPTSNPIVTLFLLKTRFALLKIMPPATALQTYPSSTRASKSSAFKSASRSPSSRLVVGCGNNASQKTRRQSRPRCRAGVVVRAGLLGDREDKSLWDELLEADDGSSSSSDPSSEQPLWEMLADEEEDMDVSAMPASDAEVAEKKKKVVVKKTRKKSSVGGGKSATASKNKAKDSKAVISNATTAKATTTKSLRSTQKNKEEEEEDISAEDAAAELFRDTTRDALRISKSDFTVSSIIDKINRGKVDLRPSYQREYVWTVRTASKLIESLLLNIPVPTMFFHEVKSGKLEVVDGKQRLTSIFSFVQNEFPGGQAFKLSGLEVYHELNGKTFDELNETFQEIILDYPLNVHTISKTSQPDFVFEVFERLNMGATQLNEQELRNCIYQGAYTDLLEELTLNESFLFANRSKMPHLRMRDRELILRFFTMQRTTPSGFYLPAKSWLNEEMRENKDLLPKEAAEMTELFEKTLKLSVDIFGDCAFRPAKYPDGSKKGKKVTAEDVSGLFVREYFESGEISVALWDTINSSFAKMAQDENETKLALEIKDEIVAAWINLARSDKFRRNMVSQPKAVLARDEMFRDMLLGLGLLSPNDEDENEESARGPR